MLALSLPVHFSHWRQRLHPAIILFSLAGVSLPSSIQQLMKILEENKGHKSNKGRPLLALARHGVLYFFQLAAVKPRRLNVTKRVWP